MDTDHTYSLIGKANNYHFDMYETEKEHASFAHMSSSLSVVLQLVKHLNNIILHFIANTSLTISNIGQTIGSAVSQSKRTINWRVKHCSTGTCAFVYSWCKLPYYYSTSKWRARIFVADDDMLLMN